MGELQKMIPLYKPYMPELPEIDEILHSGKLAAGEYTKIFEKLLQKFLRQKQTIAVNSFNSAVSVAATTAGLQYGDEIIASPMACLASTQPYAGEGLKIVWADIDPYTGTLDPDDVVKRITSKTRAIVHNHFCGYPGYIDEINQIGREYGLLVIDDGIECFGSTYKKQPLGNCGTDMTVFSFNPVRVLTTIDGGAITFKKEELYKKSLLVRDCGIDRTLFRDELGEINPKCDISLQGYSATLSNVNAYIGIRQFEDLEDRLAKQRNNAKKWDELLADSKEIRPVKSPDGEPNYWVYGILAPDKRECIMDFRSKGYYASGVHLNNNIYSVFGSQPTLIGVDEFAKRFLALPSGWWVDISIEN